jgi:hypothetical protein
MLMYTHTYKRNTHIPHIPPSRRLKPEEYTLRTMPEVGDDNGSVIGQRALHEGQRHWPTAPDWDLMT